MSAGIETITYPCYQMQPSRLFSPFSFLAAVRMAAWVVLLLFQFFHRGDDG